MTALPAATDFTGAAITKGQFKTAVTDLRAFLAGLIGADGTIATALDTLSTLFSAGVSAKTGAYTVTSSDRGVLFSCSGTWTLTLLAAATAGAGFAIAVKNTGTGTITIDGDSSETIDGGTTLALEKGAAVIIVCTGTSWIAIGDVTPDEVTLAAGSVVYAEDSAESQASIMGNTYKTALAAKSSDLAIAEWVRLNSGNMKAIRMEHSGVVTVSYAVKVSSGTGNTRILQNTTQIAEFGTSTSYTTKTQNLTVQKGDVIAVQVRDDDSVTVTVKDFKILVAVAP